MEIVDIAGNDSERAGTRIAQYDGATSTGDTGVKTRAYKGATGYGIARDA